MKPEDYSNPMRDQALTLPSLMRDMYADIEPKARVVMTTPEIFNIQQVILTGCGDSWAAVVAAKMMLEKLTGFRCEAVKTIDLARYYPSKRLGGAPGNPLVIGVSNSGKVARMAEAMERATKYGAFTLAVTGNEDSPLAQASKRVLKLDIPKFASAPGTRSYMVSVLALYLLVVRIGEVRGKYTMDEAKAMRKEVLRQADLLEKMLPEMDLQALRIADAWKGFPCFDTVGSGFDEPTVFYGMAKVYEAIGKFSTTVNTEEWLHLNFFMRDRENIGTTLVVNSHNAAQSRAREVMGYMKQLGRPMIVISDKGRDFWGVDCEYVLVPGSEYEFAMPLTHFVPFSLIFGYIMNMIGEKSGRGVEGPWSFSKGAACVRESEKVIL